MIILNKYNKLIPTLCNYERKLTNHIFCAELEISFVLSDTDSKYIYYTISMTHISYYSYLPMYDFPHPHP